MATESRPLVVLAGPIHPDGQALLERTARVVVCADETEEGLVRAAAEAQGILFRIKPCCTESLMAACPRLRVVGRHGVGLDTVDIPAATRLGVAVVPAPGSNSQAGAEHALMLMLACVKHTREVDRATRAGDWGGGRGANTELAGKTLGIVGVGNVGRRVAKFAGALGMRGLAPDKHLPHAEGRRRGGGAVLVNPARGGVQDEHALFEALTRGQLGAAGLDVWEEEPVPRDNPLLNLDSVVCSGHVAGVTVEAIRQMAVQVAGEMARVLRGERPDVLVNPEVWPRLGRR